MMRTSTLAILLSLSIAATLSHARAETSDQQQFKELNILAATGFDKPANAEQIRSTIAVISTARDCQLALQLSGTRQLICTWQYPYRAATAKDQFTKLNAWLENHLTRALDDQDVNHPDFYDLKTYRNKAASFAVSLKDKGALDQTYVFLRVSKTEDN